LTPPYLRSISEGLGLEAERCLREGQIGCHGVAVERRLFDLRCPVGLVDFQACGGLAIQLHQIEFFVVDGRVVFVNSLLQSLRVQVHLLGKLFDGVCLLWWLIGGVVYPASLESLHDGVVGHEEAGHVLISPTLERDHLERGEEVTLALIVEAVTILVDYNAVVVTPNHSIRLLGSGVDKLAMHAVERARSAGTDF